MSGRIQVVHYVEDRMDFAFPPLNVRRNVFTESSILEVTSWDKLADSLERLNGF